MQHQDIFNGVLARVQQSDGVFTHVHLKINLQCFICLEPKEQLSGKLSEKVQRETVVSLLFGSTVYSRLEFFFFVGMSLARSSNIKGLTWF